MSASVQIVPLQAVPSQTLTVQLGGQTCQIAVYQKSTGLFMDLSVNDSLLLGGTICLTGVPIVRNDYLGFAGDLVFGDTQGEDDPVYTGLGSRWVLGYVS